MKLTLAFTTDIAFAQFGFVKFFEQLSGSRAYIEDKLNKYFIGKIAG
jgi:hypothetical protein